MILPSKELLSEVLDKKVTSVKASDGAFVFINWTQTNIYELMRLMKEWAWNNNYYLVSGLNFDIDVKDKLSYDKYSCDVHLENKTGFKFVATFGTDYEFEAVTKACEWIMEQQ